MLAIANKWKPCHVVCDDSDFSIGYALIQYDADGTKHFIFYHARQMQPDERKFPVHDKKLLAMKNALAKFRV